MATIYQSNYSSATYTLNLTIDKNGGDTAPSGGSASKSSNAASVTVYKTVSDTLPTWTGHTFLGYSIHSASNPVSIQAGGTVSRTFTRSATLTSEHSYTTADGDTYIIREYTSSNQSGSTWIYAQWELQTFTVTYNANGGTGAPEAQTKTYGVDLTLSSTAPTKENYIFQGWSTSSTGSVEYQPSGTFTTNADTILYAIWTPANSTLATISSTVLVEGNGMATWNVVDNSYTYSLSITYSNAPEVVVTRGAGSQSAQFTIPSTWYAYIPNSETVTATATLTTFNGSTALGTSSKTFTVKVQASIKPTISAFTATHYSSNATVSGWATFTQGYSQADLSATATAGTGATIVSYAFSGDGVSQSGAGTSVRSSMLETAGSKTYTLIVTDSRGRTATSTVTITVYPYTAPSVSSMATYRCLSNGTQSDTEGTYAHSTPVFAYASVNSKNSLSVAKIEYKQHSGTTWTSGVSPITSGTGYTFGGGNINISYTYDVQCTITDALGNTATLSILLPPVVGFAIGMNNDRARFGGPVEEAGLVCDWDFKLKGDFIMSDGNGNTATMTYADLVSILSGGGGNVNISQDSGTGILSIT